MERGLERRDFANLHLSSDSISRPKTEAIYRCELTARVRDAPDNAGDCPPSTDGRVDGRADGKGGTFSMGARSSRASCSEDHAARS